MVVFLIILLISVTDESLRRIDFSFKIVKIKVVKLSLSFIELRSKQIGSRVIE